MQERHVLNDVSLAKKKNVYISLPFNGDSQAQIITRRLVNATAKTFPAANLRIHFSSTPLLRFHLKDIMPVSSTSFCVYSFTCSCGACYIGRTTRRLSDRIREHHPKWLYNGPNKTIRSSIVAHLVDNDHRVNVGDAFRPIFQVRVRQSRCIRYRILAAAEAVGIRLYNPLLCTQKQFIQPLHLPWPKHHPSPRSNSSEQHDVTISLRQWIHSLLFIMHIILMPKLTHYVTFTNVLTNTHYPSDFALALTILNA